MPLPVGEWYLRVVERQPRQFGILTLDVISDQKRAGSEPRAQLPQRALPLLRCYRREQGTGLGAVHTGREHASDMNRLTIGPIPDLVPAGSAVGHQNVVWACFADRRQKREFGHRQRDIHSFGLIAEGSCHAAAA